MNMTFSTLLTRLATCHCLRPAMSFVFRGLGPRSVSCTESANITPDSELWREGGAATLLVHKDQTTETALAVPLTEQLHHVLHADNVFTI